jgi:hypothetical protein
MKAALFALRFNEMLDSVHRSDSASPDLSWLILSFNSPDAFGDSPVQRIITRSCIRLTPFKQHLHLTIPVPLKIQES